MYEHNEHEDNGSVQLYNKKKVINSILHYYNNIELFDRPHSNLYSTTQYYSYNTSYTSKKIIIASKLSFNDIVVLLKLFECVYTNNYYIFDITFLTIRIRHNYGKDILSAKNLFDSTAMQRLYSWNVEMWLLYFTYAFVSSDTIIYDKYLEAYNMTEEDADIEINENCETWKITKYQYYNIMHYKNIETLLSTPAYVGNTEIYTIEQIINLNIHHID